MGLELWLVSAASGLMGSLLTVLVGIWREKRTLSLRTTWELRQKTFLDVLAISRRLDEIGSLIVQSLGNEFASKRPRANELAKKVNEADRISVLNALLLANSETVISKFELHGEAFDMLLGNFLQYEKAIGASDSRLQKKLQTELTISSRLLKKRSNQLLEQMKSEIS